MLSDEKLPCNENYSFYKIDITKLAIEEIMSKILQNYIKEIT